MAHLDETAVLDVLLGVADAAAAAAARDHAAGCEGCRAFMAQVARAIDPASLAGAGEHESATQVGRRIGRHHVRARLGAGGMGEVWSAHDPELDRMVAIKRLHAELRERATLLEVEARALARLSHPHVVTVLEVVHDEDGDALVMELVDGPALVRWQRQPGRTQAEILACYLGAGRALAAAHAAGVIHRDFKPHNVLVGPDDRARVVDFGLASLLGAPVVTGTSGRGDAGTSVVGTPAYMAPEVQAGARADARADQYSFCVALWEALAGAHPFAATDARRHAPLPGPRPIPGRVARVLRRGLAEAPSRRFPDMEALLAALVRPRWRMLEPLAAAGLLVGMFVLAGADPTARASACDRAAAELTLAWNPEIADEIAHAFESVDPRRGARVMANVRDTLDADADAWRVEVAGACVGEPRRGAARLRCLAAHGQQIDAFVERLLRVDAESLGWASRASAALPRSDECRDVDPSFDPVGADQSFVAELRRALADTRAEIELGVDDGVVARAQALLDRCEPLGVASLTADARVTLGVAVFMAARIPEAQVLFERAYFDATTAGDRRIARMSATNLVGILLEQDRMEEAEAWLRHATSMVVPDDVASLCEIRLLEARLAGQLGQRARVDALLADALQLAPADSAVRTRVLLSAADARMQAEQPEAALALAREAAAQIEAIDGADTFDLARAENLVGIASMTLDRPHDGARAFARALALLEAHTADGPMIPYTRGNLALAAAETGDTARAIALLEACIADFSRLYGPRHRYVRTSYENLANQQFQRGAHAEALAAADTALELARSDPQANPEIALSLRARSLAALGRSDAAIDTWRISIAGAQAREPVDVDRLGWEQTQLAEVLLAAGRVREADRASRDALDSYARSPITRPRDRARTHLTAAKIADALRQPTRAREQIAAGWRALLAGAMEPREFIAALEIATWLAARA